MIIAVEILEQVLQQRGYKKLTEGSPNKEIEKKGCYQRLGGPKVYVNYVGKAPRSSLIVSPDTKERQGNGWLWTPEWEHSHQLKSFPKRKNKGKDEIHYGKGIRFESAQSFQVFCDYLEGRVGPDTALPMVSGPLHSSAAADAGIGVSAGAAVFAFELVGTATAKQTTKLMADDQGKSLAMLKPTVLGQNVLIQTTRRIGHDSFRDALVQYWGGACAITGMSNKALLRASHIKPWAASTSEEQTSLFNGLLLAPQWDAAFDCGLMTLDAAGAVLVSPLLSGADAEILGFEAGMRLRKPLQPQHQVFMEYHRQHVFLAV